jgi:hypothetical protein
VLRRAQGNALLNQIAGKTHSGAAAAVPAVFGMNFQSVYVGQSVNEAGVAAGGYQNAAALPSELLGEVEYVDTAIGEIVKSSRTRASMTTRCSSSPRSMAIHPSTRPVTSPTAPIRRQRCWAPPFPSRSRR